MKNRNLIKESQGIVDKPGVEWYTLSKVIQVFINDYCKQDKNSEFANGNKNLTITLKNIIFYYNKNYKKIHPNIGVSTTAPISTLIPDWIYDFNIKIKQVKIQCAGAFDEKSIKQYGDKISFDIFIKRGINYNIIYQILTHEFQHAYSHWLMLCRNANIYKSDSMTAYNCIHDINTAYTNSNNIFALAVNTIYKNKPDDIQQIFTNAEYLKYMLAQCFYYSFLDETRSFKQGYISEVKQNIASIIYGLNPSQINDLKHNQKNIIYEIYSKNNSYKIYEFLYRFIKKLEENKIDDNILKDAIKNIQPAMNYVLNKKVSSDLLKNYKDNVQLIFKQLLKVFKHTFYNVLISMQKIFYKLFDDISNNQIKNNSINESQGLIDKDGIQWNDLSDLITDYVYDLQNGLNADPFYNGEDTEISMGQIESYYQYINSKKIPNYIIPNWISSFTINIIRDKNNNGSFLKKSAKLNNNKLVFTIEVNTNMENPDAFCNTLVHEFQHAYTRWIELTKKLYLHNNRTANLYYHSTKAFDDEKYGGKYHPMVMQKFEDLIEINDEIYTNPQYLERTLLTGFYYSDVDELRSFIQEFATDMMKKIKNDIVNIRKQIKQSLEFKGDFNNVSKIEQFNSNILNNLSISCYSSKYYKIYKAYYNFYKKLEKMNVDADVAAEAIKGASKAIRMSLYISPNKKLIQFEGDENDLLKQIAKKQIPIYENVLKKMQRIFVKLIMEIPV